MIARTLWGGGWLQEENRKVIEGDEALAWMASVHRVCLNYYFIIIVATESRFVERVANFRINTHTTSSAISSYKSEIGLCQSTTQQSRFSTRRSLLHYSWSSQVSLFVQQVVYEMWVLVPKERAPWWWWCDLAKERRDDKYGMMNDWRLMKYSFKL